jgi:hypothetical protein
MNNKPKAWMIKTLDGRSLMLYGEEQPPKFKEDVQYIPLYTHPVKELTDEEITAIWQTDECYQKAQNFARALLRKAQEK